MDSKEEYLSQIDMAMGGHTAEELVYGGDHVTAGCSSDLNKATVMAQAMVQKLGMYGEEVGYIYVEDNKPYWEEDTKVSEKFKSKTDMMVKQILKVNYN
jgi:ATP-dependent metalloprotease